MFYLIVISLSTLLIIGFNLLLSLPLSSQDIASTCFSTLIGVIAVIAIDAVSALVIRRLTPKQWYMPERRIFKVSKREHRFYQAIKIKKWKDSVPELGIFTGFSKSRLESQSDLEYLKRFIIESNWGIIIHIANALLGFLIAFIPFCSSVTVFLPICAVNLILSLLPVAILRYTEYTLLPLYKRSLQRQKRSN